MTEIEKQIVLSSYLGDCYWMRQKRTLRIKFGGYVKSYLEYKWALITTMQKSKIWGSQNKKNILYEFTVGKSKELDKLKLLNFWKICKEIGDLSELGLALLIFDNGSFHKTLLYYELCVGKYYEKSFANRFCEYLNIHFNINGTVHKTRGARGYIIQFKVYDTPIIAQILKKFSNHTYSYKIPSPETIAKIASRYKDMPKDLEGRRAYDIVRSLGKLKES
jgi:hypothetical protein